MPKVSDFFSDDNRDYLVMDFVPGSDLKELMQASHERGEKLAETACWIGRRRITDALTTCTANRHRRPPRHQAGRRRTRRRAATSS